VKSEEEESEEIRVKSEEWKKKKRIDIKYGFKRYFYRLDIVFG
jgi:hypothetical protein